MNNSISVVCMYECIYLLAVAVEFHMEIEYAVTLVAVGVDPTDTADQFEFR